MTSTEFEAALQHEVAPRLEQLGYQHDQQQRAGDELFGFSAVLPDGRRAIIQFQRQQPLALDRFTVNLIDALASEIQPCRYGMTGVRAARLSTVLWFVYQSRRYPTFDYWWSAHDEQERSIALRDAVEVIEQYGVPWLEDPDAARPWEMPVQRATEFMTAVQENLASALEQSGYSWQCQSLAGAVAYCYFSKRLSDGTFALIELQPIYSLDPDEFNFDVRLQRRGDADPLSFSGDYDQWRSSSLAQIVWQARGNRAFERLSVSEVKELFWHYRDRAELDAQLQDALEQIKQFGCTWVEQADGSKVIQ